MPAMIAAARQIKVRLPEAAFVIAGVENVSRDVYSDCIGAENIPMIIGRTPEIMNAAGLR